MRVVVLLRRLRGRPDGQTAPGLLGRCDEAALAAALSLRGEDTSITALAAGPEREVDVLSRAVGSGATRAVRIGDPLLDSLDYHGIARVLASAARHLGYDLILAGDRSEDEVQGAVGPAVAELLSIPHLTSVLDLRAEGRSVLATRRERGMVRTLKLALPALITVASWGRGPEAHAESAEAGQGNGSAAPASVSDTQIETLDLATLGIAAPELKHRDRCLGKAHAVRVVRNATMVQGSGELIARLKSDRLLEP
jgi:electron transfer flavoprotein beta subunit